MIDDGRDYDSSELRDLIDGFSYSGFIDGFYHAAKKDKKDVSPEDEPPFELWDDLFSEPTKEFKCSCGAWAVYGKSGSLQLHQDYCDLKRK